MKDINYLLLVFVMAFGLCACNRISNARNIITPIPPAEGPAKYTSVPPLCLDKACVQSALNVIGGEEIAAGHKDYDSNIRISTDGAGCSGTVIGPRVILTAAHCGKSNAISKFTIKGKEYTAVLTRSSLYPGQDHDVNLGLVNEEIKDIDYEQIAESQVSVGDAILMFGYGCIEAGGGGGNDGVLRFGPSEVSSFSSYDFVAKKPGGVALCFGDSGGPSYIGSRQSRRQVGVASKGNISDTSYFADLTKKDSQDFLKKFAADNQVDICGVTKDCSGPAPESIVVASEKLGDLKMELKPETLDPDYVKRHMEMLVDYLESNMEAGEGTKPPLGSLPSPFPGHCP